MHAEERERLILEAMRTTGFVSYRDLESQMDASPATIRRDLTRLEGSRRLLRVHGGAKLPDDGEGDSAPKLVGTPFDMAITQHLAAKKAIGLAAAGLCRRGEGIMLDGGTTTLQMCPHLEGLGLQVLTNSLHIINALILQTGTNLLVPSGAVFREQNIILAPAGEDSMPRFHAPKLFMGAAAIGPQGIMQQDVVLVAAERRLISRAEEVIVLVDSSKFRSTSGAIVCGLNEIDIVITDDRVTRANIEMLNQGGVKVVIA